MTEFPHDQFVKDYLPKLLSDYGTATAAVKISVEVREIDVLFIPNQPVSRDILGLLGEIAQKTCLLEVFRNSVTVEQIRSCMCKLFDYQKNQIKEAQKSKQQLTENELPYLWIITPTLSQNILNSFGATAPSPESPSGVYLLPQSFRTGIIVVHQLPSIPSTLWLRILGKGQVQQRALNEVESLPVGSAYKEIVLELMYKLVSILEINRRNGQTVEPEDVELIMRISALYEEKLQELAQQSRQQGLQQGEVKVTIRLLKRLLGELPPDVETIITNLPVATLENLAEALLDFNTLEDLTQWLNTQL